jgi:multiple sugar transport system ATP-binding protein
MNFLPGQIEGDKVKTAIGELPLPAEARGAGARDVIVGIRPENFEDAAMVRDGRERGVTFKAKIDLVESMGSEQYAYFEVAGEGVESQELAELAQDSGLAETPSGGGGQIVARIDAASPIRRGEEAEIWVDASKLHLFDPGSGLRLGDASQPPQAG